MSPAVDGTMIMNRPRPGRRPVATRPATAALRNNTVSTLPRSGELDSWRTM